MTELRILSDAQMAELSNIFPEGFTGRVGTMIAKSQAHLTAKQIVEWLEEHNKNERPHETVPLLTIEDWLALKELAK